MSLTPEGLAKIERKARDKYHDRCFCGLRRGLHVFLLSLLAVPFAWVYATLSAFYTGTLTWYNVFTHYNEDRGCCHKGPSVKDVRKIFFIFFYPFIPSSALGNWLILCWAFESRKGYFVRFAGREIHAT